MTILDRILGDDPKKRPLNPFAHAISYGVLGPMLYRALQKERNER